MGNPACAGQCSGPGLGGDSGCAPERRATARRGVTAKMFPNTRFSGMQLMVLIFSGLSLCLSTNTFREYHFIKILKNWAEAQRYCRENFHDLAAVEDQNENQKLLRTLTEQGLYVWIGLQEETSKWKWSKDNEHYYDKVDFNNWNSGQPNRARDSCVGMLSNGLWLDESCKERHPAVCWNGNGGR
ncbi:L-selectin-like [Gouania willdenowi]|uniref:L-selectin-like n=1 Tax=Gouania willdenowi TaxID=441366 RepID=UPI0010548E18|nr:L-selectin-like [Gouania willdenowi]